MSGLTKENDGFHNCPKRAVCDEIKEGRLSVSENPLTSPSSRLGNGWKNDPVDF